jgi:hypothetical protein
LICLSKYRAVLLLLTAAAVAACNHKKTLFEMVPPSYSGIDFMNRVEENDTVNVLEYMNVYTGAGVAAGDVNNDGLTDLYFSSNRNGGRLYLNKGNLRFEDATKKAGFINNRWETGVAMGDMNQDGWLDIYVNVAGTEALGNLANMLYINNRDGTFTESAAKYGLADTRLTMNSSFVDYDRDGDLDVFLITNPADERVTGINHITDRQVNGESKGTDILYRNNGDGTYTDVSAEAGILVEGYSLGAAISDLNSDGWPDIFVSNDFLTNDIVYINNRDGTFTDRIDEMLKHSSFASMGNDVADFNNDCLPDLYVLDMLPEDNFRRKMIMPATGYDRFQLSLQKGYHPQYSRNTLQLNNGDGSFSEIAFLAGVSSTDWSWSALWGDYDNDGDKDMMVTNGFYRDLGSLDYIHYQAKLNNPMGSREARKQKKLEAIKKLKNIPLQNYLFDNNGQLGFDNRSDDWGFSEKGFSNGACYADLDNDGDLELVTNDFNGVAKLYRNNANELTGNSYLKIKLKGKPANLQGIGAKAWLYTGEEVQYLELYPQRGFESSVEPVLHFGTGKLATADSLVIVWPDQKRQVMRGVKLNQTVHIEYPVAAQTASSLSDMEKSHDVNFERVVENTGLEYTHRENEYTDFKLQPLLPAMHSRNGPGVAVGDVDGDHLEDVYIGAPFGSKGRFFFQKKNEKFVAKDLEQSEKYEDMGVLLFDADGDSDLDLYVVSGGSENMDGSSAQQDRLYLNDGSGDFSLSADAVPDTKSSGSCVVACDYDKDGDLDLFVGGRVVPGSYPQSPRSYLLQNNGGRFSDVSASGLPSNGHMGMVSSALWTDYDNDEWPDLLVVGEFMPLIIIPNVRGKLMSEKTIEVPGSSGWWNSIGAGDFDEDGDIDYVCGNIGLNTRFRASADKPVCIYAKDFDKNGRIDPVLCYYIGDKNYVYATRDEMIRQINGMRGRFGTYQSYASATFEQSFLQEEIRGAQIYKMECAESSIFENKGGGRFERRSLPLQAQFAPIFGILTGDYNEDGYLDMLLAGNSYATEVSTGRYDALTGLMLAGNGKGQFEVKTARQTGWRAARDVKGLSELVNVKGENLVLAAGNNDSLEVYRRKIKTPKVVEVNMKDAFAIVKKKNGMSYRQEFYWGNNYLSQSSRNMVLSNSVDSVILFDANNNKRNHR